MLNCPNCSAVVRGHTLTCDACGAVFRHPHRRWLSGTLVAVLFLIGVFGTLIYGGVRTAREASQRTTARCRLKLLGSAAYSFESTHKHFPPRNLPSITKNSSIAIASGAVPQSFLADLLPYMNETALFSQMNSQVPWTNTANKPVYSTVIPNYLHPMAPNPPRNEEGYALTHFATNSKCICDTKTVTLAEITDGTSNTMLLTTVNADFQAWGDPTNYRDPSHGFGGGPDAFGAIGREKFVQILMFDGSVKSVPTTLSLDISTKLGDPRDGQTRLDF